MTLKPAHRRALSLTPNVCYGECMHDGDKNIADPYDDYELTPDQMGAMKTRQWSHAIEGMHISDEDMLRMTKRFYATGQDKLVRDLLAKATREGRPFDEVWDEHMNVRKQP